MPCFPYLATEVGHKHWYRMGLHKVTCGKYSDLISSNSIVVLLILSFVHHHTVQSRLSIVLRRTKVLLWLLSSACCFCCFNSCASLPLDVDQLIIIEIIFPQSFHVLTILISYQYYFHGWFFVLIIFLCIFKILSSFCMLCMNSGPNFEEFLIKFNFLFSGNLNLNCCWDMLVIWEVIYKSLQGN